MGADSRRNEGMGSASIGSYRHLGGNGGVGYRHLSAPAGPKGRRDKEEGRKRKKRPNKKQEVESRKQIRKQVSLPWHLGIRRDKRDSVTMLVLPGFSGFWKRDI